MSTTPVTHYPEGIWVERRSQTQATLWETTYYEAYTLVDDNHQPLRDEHNQEYLFETLAQAERKTQELLMPMLNLLARAYADAQMGKVDSDAR